MRTVAELPPGGPLVSVETALNSRCTSDDNGTPEIFHWGMFDKDRKLSPEQIRNVTNLIRIPRFTRHHLPVRPRDNEITFIIDNRASGLRREWLMVESGMQQQALGLICSALGIGMVFRNLGREGTGISDTEHATVSIRLDPMKPAYGGDFWTRLPPAGTRPWVRGNLPDPERKGEKPLITSMKSLTVRGRGAERLTERSLSQLLWAARGRTPHLYKSRAWGMTIPTWAGKQGISDLFLISDRRVSKYVNWKGNRPTHSLDTLGETDRRPHDRLRNEFAFANTFIVLGKNEAFARALWETGYQLLNILLQAHALDLSWEAVLLNETQKTLFCNMGINSPVALVAMRREKWKPEKSSGHL
ncbi:hypothetical protein DENIS_4765 [Desulfonema ishimotonii]|uniref:Nitroreductase domain-containing protein n=2 Tax=Desulfonema ishimotonii TaxID=45657 RepID=A0A401G3E7_9BACT|nr:hypothetical protein DENIS_4765 [Desulfonema ishimotonii]